MDKPNYKTAKALDATNTGSHLTVDMDEMLLPKYLVYGKAYPVVCKNETEASRCARRCSVMPMARTTTFRVFCVSRGEWVAAFRDGMELHVK